MTFDWLLTVIVIAGGAWYFGRLYKKNLPHDYLVGLNFLLDEQPDKAVNVFIKMLEVDSETIETHLALGKLFRRRGEVDRAIRIHQNLISRPNLEKNHQEQALLELGQDYLSAGMFDRAEQIYLQLIDKKEFAVLALKSLLSIYQHEKNWEKAIQVAQKMATKNKTSMSATLAHLYCELAEQAFQKSNIEKSKEYLKNALTADTRCVRASLLLARLEMHQEDYYLALQWLKNIKQQNTDFLSEAIESLAICYEKLGEEEKLIVYLEQILAEFPRIPVALILSERIRKWKGDKVAASFVADYVRQYPSVAGFILFIDLYLNNAYGQVKEDLIILQRLMKKLSAEKPNYQCTTCGYTGNLLQWQCPGCKEWESIKPSVYRIE